MFTVISTAVAQSNSSSKLIGISVATPTHVSVFLGLFPAGMLDFLNLAATSYTLVHGEFWLARYRLVKKKLPTKIAIAAKTATILIHIPPRLDFTEHPGISAGPTSKRYLSLPNSLLIKHSTLSNSTSVLFSVSEASPTKGASPLTIQEYSIYKQQ